MLLLTILIKEMKEVKIGNKEYVFFEVPDDVHTFREKLSYEGGYWLAMFEPRIPPYLAIQSVRIEGNSFCKFKIITTTNTITEEIAKSVVEKHVNIFYRNYNVDIEDLFIKGWTINWDKITALESFYSLMDSSGLDRKNKNYLLIEKLKQ